jgi:cell division protein FtsL
MNKLNAMLLLLILGSSIFLIKSRYEYRKLTSEIAIKKQENEDILQKQERLIYEYDSYSKPERVMKWAAENNMGEPKIANTIFMDN